MNNKWNRNNALWMLLYAVLYAIATAVVCVTGSITGLSGVSRAS